LNTETVQKKKPVATEPTKKLIPEITTTVTDVIETVTTTHISAQEENTEIRPNIAANNKQSSESGNWVTVLGVIAALFASAAAVTGALAWREKNRY
jgi:uncharacterized membrane protein